MLGKTNWLDKTFSEEKLGKTNITLAEQQTVTVEIEAILNDRPIKYVSSKLDDEEPFISSHLRRRITNLPCPLREDPMTPPTTLKKAKLRTKQEEETNSYNISGTVG